MKHVVPAWQLRLFSCKELLQLNGVIDSPNISPATRLARAGFGIMENAEYQRAKGELELATARRRR